MPANQPPPFPMLHSLRAAASFRQAAPLPFRVRLLVACRAHASRLPKRLLAEGLRSVHRGILNSQTLEWAIRNERMSESTPGLLILESPHHRSLEPCLRQANNHALHGSPQNYATCPIQPVWLSTSQ